MHFQRLHSEGHTTSISKLSQSVQLDSLPSWRIHLSLSENMPYLLYYTHTDAQLELFGSSANGFGSSDSDADLCLILNEEYTAEYDTLTAS